tara:strand:+ start:235 stop:477 length:243 start_codon:yes stop_codon:yes gene_type:complete
MYHRKRHFAFYGGEDIKIGGSDIGTSNNYEFTLGDIFINTAKPTSTESKKKEVGGGDNNNENENDDEFSNYIVMNLISDK